LEEPTILFSTDVEKEVEKTDNPDSHLKEVLSYYDAEYHAIVALLIEKQVPFSEDGSFFLMEGEKQIAEAVLGFEDEKIAIGALSERDKAVFEQNGYRVFNSDTLDISLVL
jgi:hypothetical protein